jgi:hypothetical protein
MDLQLSEDPDALLVEQAQALDAALRDVAAHRGPPPCYQIVWRVRRHSTVIAARSSWCRARQTMAKRIHYEHPKRQALEAPP